MNRIFFVTAETWPTFRADVSVLFGKYLPEMGVKSDIVTGSTPNTKAEPWGGGKAILCDLPSNRLGTHVWGLLHIWRELLRLNREFYVAIQVRDLPFSSVLALLIARWKGLPFFYWMSYPIPEGQIASARARGLKEGLIKYLFPWIRGRLGHFFLYKIVLPYADHIFVQSNRMRDDMVERGIDVGKMTPVPMGVDIDAIQRGNIRPIEDLQLAGRRVLVYLGTLDRPRQIEKLFEMLEIVRRTEPLAMLVLVGDAHDPQHRNWLKERALSVGVAEHVLWTGWLPMYEAWRYVRAADIGLSPFPRGNLLDSASPTKVPEYLALGLPVVCNDNPDQEELIKNSGAGRCAPYTPEYFAHAVLEIFEMSPAKYQEIVKNGQEIIKTLRDYRRLAAMVAAQYRYLVPDAFVSNRAITKNVGCANDK